MVLKLGIDGIVDVQYPETQGCCPPSICNLSIEQITCTFVNLLPSGPLWDQPKSCVLASNDPNKTSMVDVAKFIATMFHDSVQNFLWPALRESFPWSAATTLEDWLTRLNWSDCYGQCRNASLTALSPLEVMGVCGPIYCGADFSDDFNRAYNHALLQSLSRFLMHPLPTLASLNSILEPLGVEASPGADGIVPPVCSDSTDICITLSIFRQTLEVPKVNCGDTVDSIPSYVDLGCDRPAGLPEVVWPTIMAAECVTRAFLPKSRLCVVQKSCSNIETLDQLRAASH